MRVIKNIILKYLAKFFIQLTRNTIGLTGFIITTVTLIINVITWFLYYFEIIENPYTGIFVYVLLPLFFVTGLVLIAIGYYAKRKEVYREEYKVRILLISILTMVNLVLIISLVGGGISYMNTSEFCGTVCHTVMAPEYTAYQNSAHSKIRCVDCHIWEEVSWVVKAKISGLRQVAAVLTNSYSKPIPSPVHDLVPARGTCEKCHWPEKFHGDRRRIYTNYSDDEKNTPNYSVLYLKVGGQKGGPEGSYEGIHWHVNKDTKVKFRSLDKRRHKIGWVQVTKKDGSIVEYATEEYGAYEKKTELEEREMDCLDCHNRPTHEFYSVEKALSMALSYKKISSELPYIYREGLRILEKEYLEEQIESEIYRAVKSYYTKEYPEIIKEKPQLIENTSSEMVRIYRRNNWPKMELRWGYHRSHIGHNDVPGCGRCHNADMLTKDGKGLSDVEADCENCHDILIEDEKDICAVQKVLHPARDECLKED